MWLQSSYLFLGVCRELARRTMEVRALRDLEAVRYELDGWGLLVGLGQRAMPFLPHLGSAASRTSHQS